MFYRATAARSILRAAPSTVNASITRSILTNTIFKSQFTASARQSPFVRPTTLALATRKPVTTALVRYASTAEKKAGTELVEDPDVDMMAGVKNDVKVIKDTFSLQDVPKEALYLGLAGVTPYVVTSLNTIYLAWEMNNALTTGSGKYISGETAELLMNVMEPIQVGYGAVILSFLGAIHWGLEWAGYGGKVGYRRYAYGVIAPAVAWPTLLFPAEYALITQFLAFTFLYYNDARAAVKGWTPSWYHMYRFVLTFVVGASIVASLIGREQLASHYASKHGVADKVQALRSIEWKNEAEAAKEAEGKEE
ncbi:uncharacterized protein CIMG_01583 [Coccidioides immitis RS]|uniref:Mitochondrial inner membrane protein 1 n=4 Tax=Coccidioides immitis TaxID=5501 RepID=J3KJI1_COCIM|nr:uncharacterized protein CIMG_01583 [Coccidioides immitis RS]KMP01563.1 hypothetical protein CIRG_01702 [Coccidioides immitis RMSCC 2394]KMU76463.1 hypothetical protein CISG_01196 [Coccidioides immitis RMSCC 3703]KMU87555.1 hypothetical protein CIHG_05948 [Coccidioides immitis H538.4]TPX25634.1 hypothetical protein DIZ76_011090 [Coccidioides immitis]EAS36229.3 hypothetical protein CIMG_01583 [Coccidioides immitis RS]